MDVSECVLSAGRAVLDMVEREWQPLSAGELEHRLDQAVEEILESELLAKLEKQPHPTTIYVQLLQNHMGPQVLHTATTSRPPEEEEEEEEAAESQERFDTVDSPAIKCTIGCHHSTLIHTGELAEVLCQMPFLMQPSMYISDLLQSSKSRTRMAGRARLSLSHTILLSLTLLSERVSYRSVSRRFQLEKGNIHRIFFSFCEHVNMLEEKHIRWPVGTEAVEALFPFSSLLGNEDQDEGQGVPQVLGVLGHTRIPIRLPIGKHDVESIVPEVKRMKAEAHPDSWLKLELVCDRRGRFLHCRISKGSDLDKGSALRDKLKQHPELMPSGSCLVARCGYPLTAQILTPYTGSFGPREELFNKILEEHFQILDQAVANLRATFHRLRYLDIGNYDRAKAVVLTACVLHNVLLDIGQVVQGEREVTLTQEGEGEMDDEGVQRRDSIADLMFKSFDSGST